METLVVEPEEEVDTDEKGPYILQSEVEKAIKEISKLTCNFFLEIEKNRIELKLGKF